MRRLTPPVQMLREATVKLTGRERREVAEEIWSDGFTPLAESRLGDHSPGLPVKETPQHDGQGLAGQIANQGHGAGEGQRTAAGKIPQGAAEVA